MNRVYVVQVYVDDDMIASGIYRDMDLAEQAGWHAIKTAGYSLDGPAVTITITPMVMDTMVEVQG
jgi:hypothetical protein